MKNGRSGTSLVRTLLLLPLYSRCCSFQPCIIATTDPVSKLNVACSTIFYLCQKELSTVHVSLCNYLLIQIPKGMNPTGWPQVTCWYHIRKRSWVNKCYRLRHVSPKFICWSPNSQLYHNVTVFGERIFSEANKLKWDCLEWALIQYDWYPHR